MTGIRSQARVATDERFRQAVTSIDTSYPDGTAFVPADMPELAQVLARNLAERRTTVIVHDDHSEVVIEPPDPGLLALLVVLALTVVLRNRSRPAVEAGGDVVELPVGARVRWRSRSKAA